MPLLEQYSLTINYSIYTYMRKTKLLNLKQAEIELLLNNDHSYSKGYNTDALLFPYS